MAKVNLLGVPGRDHFEDDTLSENARMFGYSKSGKLKEIVDYYIKSAAETSDNELTLNKTLLWMSVLTLKQAMDHYLLDGWVELSVFEGFVEKLIELNKKRQAGKFQSERFWQSPLVQEYVDLLEVLALEAMSDDEKIKIRQKVKVRNYLRDYIPLSFTRHLSSNPGARTDLQIFLGGDYHEAQIANYQRDKYYADLRNSFLEITLNDSEGMTLDHIYQEPGFSVFERCLKEEVLGSISRKTFVNSDELELDSSIHNFINNWAEQKLDCAQLKRQDSRLVLLYGFPGQGKTSFCRRLLHDLLTTHPIEQDVYFIRLRALRKPHLLKSEVLPTLHAHLADQLNLKVDEESFSRSLIILDGLDELFMKEDLRGPDVDLILQNLVQEIKQNRDLRILLTSRLGYLDTEQVSSSGLLLLKLDLLDQLSQIEWLRAYRVFHPDCWLTEEKLEEVNNGKGYLKELISQPILLHMIASLEQDITKGVVNKGKVYELLFEQVTNPVRWKDDQIDILGKLEAIDLRSALREIAFNIFISGKEFIHKSKLEELESVKELKEKVGGKQQYFKKALKLLMVAFYLQEVPNETRRRGDDEDDHEYAVEFLHKSLQEYLTAEYIWEQTKDALLDQNRRGRYIIDSESRVLEFLQGIFGFQPMSEEILDYLVEVVNNDQQEDEKYRLAQRLAMVADFGLQKQFVYTFRAQEQDSVIEISNSIFLGWWTIYSRLTNSIDLFHGEEKRRQLFVLMLRSLCSRNEVNLKLCLQGADLRQADLHDLNLTKSDLSKTILTGANLSNADLRESDLSGANLQEANLKNAKLDGVRFIDLNRPTIDTFTYDRTLLDELNSTAYSSESIGLSSTVLDEWNHTAYSGESIGLSSTVPTGRTHLRLIALPDFAVHLPAKLIGADLTNATLTGADLKGTDLQNANLTKVVGLKVKQLVEAGKISGVKGIPKSWLAAINKMRGDMYDDESE